MQSSQQPGVINNYKNPVGEGTFVLSIEAQINIDKMCDDQDGTP